MVPIVTAFPFGPIRSVAGSSNVNACQRRKNEKRTVINPEERRTMIFVLGLSLFGLLLSYLAFQVLHSAPILNFSGSRWVQLETGGQVGGQAALEIFSPELIVAVVSGTLSGFHSGTGLIGFFFALIGFSGIAAKYEADISVSKSLAGLGIAGVVPVIFSEASEWGSWGVALVGAVCVVAPITGSFVESHFEGLEYHLQSGLVSLPLIGFAAVILLSAAGRSFDNNTSFSFQENSLVVLQAFPGSMPWYLLRFWFLEKAILSLNEGWKVMWVSSCAGSAGLLIGALIYSLLSPRMFFLLLLLRALPVIFLFDFPLIVSPSHSLTLLAVFEGLETVTVPGTGAWVGAHNSVRTRGLMFALTLSLNNLSKTLARYIVSEILASPDQGNGFHVQLCIAVWLIMFRAISVCLEQEKSDSTDGQSADRPPLPAPDADMPPLPQLETPTPYAFSPPPYMMMSPPPQMTYDANYMRMLSPTSQQFRSEAFSPATRRLPLSPSSFASSPRWSERKRLTSPRTSKDNNSSESLVSSPRSKAMEGADDADSSIKSVLAPELKSPADLESSLPVAFSAVRHNQYETIERMISDFPSLVDAVDANNKGNSLLHVACSNGYARVTKLLIKFGANVDFANADGNSPLHLSYQYGRNAIVSILIAANANENSKNQKGQIPSEMLRSPIR